MKMKKGLIVLVLVTSLFALAGCSWYIGEGPQGFEMGYYGTDGRSTEYEFRSNGEGVKSWDAPASSEYDTIIDPFTWKVYTDNGRADEIYIDYEAGSYDVIRVLSPTSFKRTYNDGKDLEETLYEKEWRLFAW